MKLRNTLLFPVLALSLTAACGDEDPSPTPDAASAVTADAAAGTADAATGGPDAMPSGDNALGVRCGPGNPECPADHTCVIQGIPGGSQMQGYCSPICNDNADCTDGYDGPGTALCFVANECSISCTDACPEGLECLSTGGPTFVCAVASGSGGGGGGNN